MMFRTPPALAAGPGALSRLPEILAGLDLAAPASGPGRSGALSGPGPLRVLVVTDPGLIKAGLLARLSDQLPSEPAVFSEVEPDPSLASAEACALLIRQVRPFVVIGFGGGSAMDVAKLATASADAGEPVAAFAGRPFGPRRTRLIQVPTTSGTGSEVTDRGILTLPGGMKQGYLSPHLVADWAVVDPELTLTLPPAMTAATGMDALTHAVEAYTSTNATSLTDTLALAAIERVGRSLRTAVHNGRNLAARTGMSEASLWAGLAFNNGGLGICHALAMALGARFHVPHGTANALLLPYVMKFNAAAAPERFARIAEALGEPVAGLAPREAAGRAVAAVFALASDVALPASLVQAGVDPVAIPLLAEQAYSIRRLVETNPRTCTVRDLEGILEQACRGREA